MNTLSYVNLFARDIVALSGFYAGVFGFKEIEAIRSPIFRGLDTGRSAIGFNAPDAYELLGLSELAHPRGVKFLLNIEVPSPAEADRLTPPAVAARARPGKAPYRHYS